MDYGLKRLPTLTRFLDDGRTCLSNNAAERAMRGVAIGRKNWTFAGSDADGCRAAAIYTLIETCKLKDLNVDDLGFSQSGSDLLIGINATSHIIDVPGEFNSNTHDGIQHIAFADGTRWDRAQIAAAVQPS